MNERRLPSLKEDWLAGNAVVAFVGVLFTAQSWNVSDGIYELPFNMTIPAFHDFVYFALGTFLFLSSFTLALASLVRPLRSQVFCASRPFSTFVALLIWIAFIVSWLSATAELPFDQWWSVVVFFGGFMFFLFLGYRFFMAGFRLTQLSTGSAGR